MRSNLAQGDLARGARHLAPGQRRPDRRQPALFYTRSWPEKWLGTPDRSGARFDLSADPRELSGGTPAEQTPQALRRSLEAASQAAAAAPGGGSQRAVDPDPEVRRALEALGYLDE